MNDKNIGSILERIKQNYLKKWKSTRIYITDLTQFENLSQNITRDVENQ